MLLHLAKLLEFYHHGFKVVNYLTLRCVMCTLTSLLISLTIGYLIIDKLVFYQIGQQVRSYVPQGHLQKAGTPTMGGVLIILASVVAVLFWADLSNHYIWTIIAVLISFSSLGFVDDYLKLIFKNSTGLTARQKFFWQLLIAVSVVIFLFFLSTNPVSLELTIPFFKNLMFNVGWWYLPFSCFVIIGTSNAVNLTDGLDGLAIMPIVMIMGALGVFAYVEGNLNFANYLIIPYVPGAGEIAVFCSAVVGAGLGFLWFNTYPAQIFMGDVGSLGLGAALGTIAVLIKQELILALMGGVFVMETASVIIQVLSFRLAGKRIFKMAPIHHHFELKGWAEPKVIVRFWIVTIILVLLGLTSLKIR